MQKSGKITLARLEEARHAIASLAAKPKQDFSAHQAIDAMAADLRRARDTLGYSYDDLAEMLAGYGVTVKPNTLRGYLNKIATAKEKETARTSVRKVGAKQRLASSSPAAPSVTSMADPAASPSAPSATRITQHD
jgi:predicted NBD/HSP70 family sugar kinase